MKTYIVMEGPEDFEKKMNFDKFMNEIVKTEKDKKELVEEGNHRFLNRKVIDKYREKTSNRIYWSKK